MWEISEEKDRKMFLIQVYAKGNTSFSLFTEMEHIPILVYIP